MRLSRYFLPILRETPKEAEIVSHRLMLRAGMVRQEAAGIYAFLPLGLRVLQKVCRIVREEQDRAGAIEMLMPTIQSAELWRESGRYDDYGKEMLRIKDRHERDDALRSDQRGDDHRDLPRLCALLQGSAAQSLSPPMEVSRRGAAALRHHALARIPDEGRLFVRPRLSPARGIPTTACSSPICGPSRGWDCAPSRWSPTPGRSAAISATNSSSSPRPARARCSATATISTSRFPRPT